MELSTLSGAWLICIREFTNFTLVESQHHIRNDSMMLTDSVGFEEDKDETFK